MVQVEPRLAQFQIFIPVVKVNINGIEGSLNAYYDEEYNDGFIGIYFYDHTLAIEGYNYETYEQDFELYVNGTLVPSNTFSLDIDYGNIDFRYNGNLLTIGESYEVRIKDCHSSKEINRIIEKFFL